MNESTEYKEIEIVHVHVRHSDEVHTIRGRLCIYVSQKHFNTTAKTIKPIQASLSSISKQLLINKDQSQLLIIKIKASNPSGVILYGESMAINQLLNYAISFSTSYILYCHIPIKDEGLDFSRPSNSF